MSFNSFQPENRLKLTKKPSADCWDQKFEYCLNNFRFSFTMEYPERNHIIQNLASLVDNTECNTTSLAVLIQNAVFFKEDIGILECISEKRGKVTKFYELVMTRVGSYRHLVTSLAESRQTRALSILLRLGAERYAGVIEKTCVSGSSAAKMMELYDIEERQKKYIIKNIVDVIRVTNCNINLLHLLIEYGIFGKDDEEVLMSIPEALRRAYRFYELIVTRSDFYNLLCSALEKTNQCGALKILSDFDWNEHSEISEKTGLLLSENIYGGRTPIRFEVLYPVRNFTGRHEELLQLHQILHQNVAENAVISKMVTIAGLGGIGKTELARRYIQCYWNELDLDVIWINAETEQTLTECFCRFATYLSLSLYKLDKQPITLLVDEVYNNLHGRRSLFVFDNTESNDYIQKFMPFRVSDKPYILVTSRDRDWSLISTMLELYEMKEPESFELVKKGLQIQDADQDKCIIRLVKRLQYFPLAMSHAVSYVKENKILLGKFSVDDYLKHLESSPETVLNSSYWLPIELNYYTQTTLTTWKKNTNQIFGNKDVGNQALWMLNIISYLHPEKIPIQLLVSDSNCANQLENAQHKKKEALRLLAKYSMFNIQLNQKTISAHRLVQEITRIRIKESKAEETTVRDALRILSVNISFDTCEHACSVFRHCSPYKTTVYEFKAITWKILDTFYPNKLTEHSSYLATQLRKVLQEHVTQNDFDRLRFEARVVDLEYEVGRYESGLEILKKIFPLYLENKAGLFSKAEVARVKHQFALFLKEQGKGTKSLSLLLESYKSLKSIHGINGFHTIKALVAITNCLHQLGHFDVHPPVNQKYLQLLRMVYKVTNPQKLVSMFKTAYKDNMTLVGSSSKYANLFFSVAECLYKLGDKDEASNIAREIYQLGRSSEDTKFQTNSMICLTFLANMKKGEGNHLAAFGMYKEAHHVLSSTQGDNNIHTITAKGNVLITLADLGQAETALEGLQDVLKTLQATYPNTPEVVDIEFNIAVILYEIGKFRESLALLNELKSKLQKKFPQLNLLLSEVVCGIKRVKESMPSTLATKPSTSTL